MKAMKRKSCGVELSPGTPSLRRRTIVASTPFEPEADHVNDDNIERQQLREKNKLEARKSIKPQNEVLESMAIVFDKLSSIIQMSNARKINANNVWKIRASDYLQRIVSGNCKDFQFLATALSTTVQIYDMKVTDLHNIVMQFANNLLQETVENENENDNGQEGQDQVKKKKATRRVKITAEPDSLRGEPELYDKPSALLYKAVHHAEDFMSSKNNFQAFLDVDPDNLDYILDSEANYYDQITRTLEPTDDQITWTKIKNAPTPDELDKMVFCPEFESFSFLNWDLNDETRAREDFHASMQQSALSYVFDMNAEAEPINDNHLSDNEMMHDDIEISEDVIKEAPVINNAVEYIVDMRPSQNEHSDKFLEYSFRPLPGAWAGPSYWKLKGNVNRVLTKSSSDCPTERIKKKKEPKPIDFLDVYETPQAANTKSKFISTVIKKNVMLNWNKDIVTFPRNHHIKVADLLRLQTNTHFFIRSDNRPVSQQSNDSSNNYDYNNLNDSEYCVANPDNDNVDTNIESQDNFIPEEEHMVDKDGPLEIIDAPALVPKLAIDYARKAKFVDMRKVQDKALNILKLMRKECTNILFSNVFAKLQNQMPGTDLSHGIAFSALLHLCNQYGIKLSQHDDLKDISVLDLDGIN